MPTKTTTELTETECCVCGISFAVPSLMYKRKSEEGGFFTCPNGHSIGWNKEGTELFRLRHKLEQEEAARIRAQEQLDGALREVTTKKREITRLRNRAKAGVCPECHRTIKQAADHMKSCHMGAEEAAKVAGEHKKAVQERVELR